MCARAGRQFRQMVKAGSEARLRRGGAGDVAQRLRTLTILPEVLQPFQRWKLERTNDEMRAQAFPFPLFVSRKWM